jgi:hypothetical protein
MIRNVAAATALCVLLVWGAGIGLAQENVGVRRLEKRIEELEMRVRRLEAKAGIQKPAAAQTPRPPAAPAKRVTDPQQPTVPVAVSPIKADLMVKKLHGDPGGQREHRFYVRLTNGFDKAITGFDGLFIVTNPAGRKLLEFAATVSRTIAPGKGDSWVGALPVDNEKPGHQRVAQADTRELRLHLHLRRVSFADGTSKEFGTEQ